MPLTDFPGRQRLIDAIDAAVQAGDDQAVVQTLRKSLCELMRSGDVVLPQAVFHAMDGHYARRRLHGSREHGYDVIAMTWGPGQGTPIHDHSGMWCVEGVWHGQLDITQYDVSERDGDDRARFIPVGSMIAGTGSAGSLIPPHEYHTIRNASDTDTAVSVHIYQRRMTRCGVFSEDQAGSGWHRREEKLLQVDQPV
ncbi:MAG: cysteine dioxygenase family protein [Pseudoxanthomonas suwonensis]|nr:cysteine dioxygenase family protein [Pseudoxanthomonas suwonensis]